MTIPTDWSRYLEDAEYFEQYWDSVYEQEYRYHKPTDLDYAVADVEEDNTPPWKEEK